MKQYLSPKKATTFIHDFPRFPNSMAKRGSNLFRQKTERKKQGGMGKKRTWYSNERRRVPIFCTLSKQRERKWEVRRPTESSSFLPPTSQFSLCFPHYIPPPTPTQVMLKLTTTIKDRVRVREIELERGITAAKESEKGWGSLGLGGKNNKTFPLPFWWSKGQRSPGGKGCAEGCKKWTRPRRESERERGPG